MSENMCYLPNSQHEKIIKVVPVGIKVIDISLPKPEYKTDGSAGMDIYASMEHERKEIIIDPGCFQLIDTGVALAIPEGYEIQIRSRSGLAAKNGIFVLNGIGTIDSDYRGELKVVLANFGKYPFVVKHKDRIAQIVCNKVEHISWELLDNLDQTERGSGGFGSTGV